MKADSLQKFVGSVSRQEGHKHVLKEKKILRIQFVYVKIGKDLRAFLT